MSENESLETYEEASEKTDEVYSSGNTLSDQEQKERFSEHKRGESYKQHIHIIIIIFMWLLGACFASMVLIRAWDFIAPDKWKWLTERQDHDLERIVFSGIILSFATKYFKKYNIVD